MILKDYLGYVYAGSNRISYSITTHIKRLIYMHSSFEGDCDFCFVNSSTSMLTTYNL